jgi:hypothetical protein
MKTFNNSIVYNNPKNYKVGSPQISAVVNRFDTDVANKPGGYSARKYRFANDTKSANGSIIIGDSALKPAGRLMGLGKPPESSK